MLCEYILKETINRKETSTMEHFEFIETHSVFFSQVLLPEKPSWLAWLGRQILPNSGSFLMTPSKQALMRVT
jgi:hypothetical protein